MGHAILNKLFVCPNVISKKEKKRAYM